MSDTLAEIRAEAHAEVIRARMARCTHGPDCVCESDEEES